MVSSRPERAPDLRLFRACLCRSLLVPIILILTNVTTKISAWSPECCPEDTIWISPTRNCSDGSKIRLGCENGFYSLDPLRYHFDEFIVVEGINPHLEFLHEWDSVPADKFCVSGKNEKERWALICFDGEEYPPSKWRYGFFGILSMISAIFLAMTLIVYAVLPELRDIQDKAMASTVAFLASSYLLLGIIQMRSHTTTANEDITCIPLAFLLYWSFLSAFFWTNIVAFNVWRSVWFKNFPVKDKELFLIFCGIGFVGPGIFLLSALVTHHTEGHHLKPRFGESACWFGGYYETWAYFYGPISCLLILNVIYLGLTCWRLWFKYRGYTGGGLRALRFNCLLYVKLFILMGITWIFEVISFATSPRENDMYWLATDILNGLQGLIIFVLLVLTRKRVKKLLARRKPFGITFPKSWSAYGEEDEISHALPMEVELSNSP